MYNNLKGYVDFLYNRLPSVYRTRDKGDLYRYLEVLASGYKTLFSDTRNILSLVDINDCPEEFLPYLCRNFGVPYINDIPPIYHRRILQNIVNLYKRKGTTSFISFLARDLSGFDVNVVKDQEVYNLYLANLNAKIDDIQDTEVAQGIIERYLDLYAPLGTDINVVLFYEIPILPLREKNDTLMQYIEKGLKSSYHSPNTTGFNTVIAQLNRHNPYKNVRFNNKFKFDGTYKYDAVYKGIQSRLFSNVEKSIEVGSKEPEHAGIMKLSRGRTYNGFSKFDGTHKYDSFSSVEEEVII